jgi:galactose mutarotase-like enzyme
MRSLVLENEKLRITVLLDKGTDIVEFLHKPTDTDFMWKSPLDWHSAGQFLPTTHSSISSFMDSFGGGWQECFPSGGPHTQYKGTEIGLHGEVCTIPWDCIITKDSPEVVEAVCTVRTYRTPFIIKKTLRLKRESSVLEMDEEITNEGKEDLPYMWGHHPSFGENILDDSCRIDLPAGKVETYSKVQDKISSQFAPETKGKWPFLKNIKGELIDNSKVLPASKKTHDLLFISGLKAGWYALTNTKKKLGIGMSWDEKLFPYVWFWQVYGGGSGYPWYGRTYNIALEPWTSWPNDGVEVAVKNGTAPILKAGKTIKTNFSAVVYCGKKKVSLIDRKGNVK